MTEREDKITAIVEQAIEAGVVPGASVVLVDGDERIEVVRGVADPRGTPLAIDTVGRYFSSVKAVTSAVVMALVEEGLLDLDSKISTVLPEWAERPPTDGIPTIRQLLSHTAGLTYQAWETGPNVHPVDAAYRDAGIDFGGYDSLLLFSAKLAEQPLCFEPGTRWRYSVSHDLLGRVIDAVTDIPVAEVFKSRLFDPLAMSDTAFHASPELAERLGACWLHHPDKDPQLELVDPAGAASSFTDTERMVSCGAGLLCTIDDYITFLLMLRNSGTHQGQQVISAASVDEIMTDQLTPGMTCDDPEAGFRVGASTGFGFGGEIYGDGSGRYGWGGYAGTSFFVDRQANRVAALQIQVQNDFTIPLWEDLLPSVID